MKLRPLKNHIIIEEVIEEETKGGLILPNSDDQKTMTGEILSVGPGIYDDKGNFEEPLFKEGQTVLFPKGTGQHIELEGRKFVFFKPEDILAIIKS